jgi:hypothetical protein
LIQSEGFQQPLMVLIKPGPVETRVERGDEQLEDFGVGPAAQCLHGPPLVLERGKVRTEFL